MKKLILTLVLLLGVVWFVSADEISLSETLEKLPPLKQGVMYEVSDSTINYISTIEVASWKGISIEVGYSQENKVIGVVSYPILKLKDLGVTLPIIDLIEFNVGYGVGVRELFTHDSELTHGICVTLINVKF